MKVPAAARVAELDRVFHLLETAALGDKVCPTNRVISERMGWAGVTSASRAIDDLERAGRIRVERTRVWRIVTILPSGKRTAWAGIGAAPAGAAAARDDQRRLLAISLGGAGEQGRRRAAGLTVTKLAIRPGFTGGPARTCQWIEAEPRGDDSCKCNAPSAPGVSWCAGHLARVYQPEADRDRLDRRLGIAKARASRQGRPAPHAADMKSVAAIPSPSRRAASSGCNL